MALLPFQTNPSLSSAASRCLIPNWASVPRRLLARFLVLAVNLARYSDEGADLCFFRVRAQAKLLDATERSL
jgi:hypothetical protein